MKTSEIRYALKALLFITSLVLIGLVFGYSEVGKNQPLVCEGDKPINLLWEC